MLQPVNTHALFVQLQTRYPTSSLVTELVQIHDGLFVVRAMIQVSGTTIATGLAAAAAVELAEDQAQVRALSVLGVSAGFSEMPTLHPISPVGNGFSPLSPPTDTWRESPIPAQFDPTPLAETLMPDSTPAAGLTTEPILPLTRFTPDELAIDSFEPMLEEPSERDLPNDSDDFLPDVLEPDFDRPAPPAPAPKPQKSPKPEKAIAPPLEEPNDLSTLIAHTDVEMDRIGWSKQEGRDYLKRTYGKSTRQRLDVDELMDFLNYLRALPTGE